MRVAISFLREGNFLMSLLACLSNFGMVKTLKFIEKFLSGFWFEFTGFNEFHFFDGLFDVFYEFGFGRCKSFCFYERKSFQDFQECLGFFVFNIE